jgi:hypothetical protein
LFLHVPQNQRTGGKFAQHFGQESICPIMKNKAKQAILKDFPEPILGRFEVTNVMPGACFSTEKRVKLIVHGYRLTYCTNAFR